jgi:hypothetical protein
MGLVYSTITISNPVDKTFVPIETKCLVDTGSTFLVIPDLCRPQESVTSFYTIRFRNYAL